LVAVFRTTGKEFTYPPAAQGSAIFVSMISLVELRYTR